MWKLTVENQYFKAVAGDTTENKITVSMRDGMQPNYFGLPGPGAILRSLGILVTVFDNKLDTPSRIIPTNAGGNLFSMQNPKVEVIFTNEDNKPGDQEENNNAEINQDNIG